MNEVKKKELSLQNWLTLIKFFVIEGTKQRLLRTRGNLGLKGETKDVKPEELIFNPWPLPIVISSGPSKGVVWWIFSTFVTRW